MNSKKFSIWLFLIFWFSLLWSVFWYFIFFIFLFSTRRISIWHKVNSFFLRQVERKIFSSKDKEKKLSNPLKKQLSCSRGERLEREIKWKTNNFEEFAFVEFLSLPFWLKSPFDFAENIILKISEKYKNSKLEMATKGIMLPF